MTPRGAVIHRFDRWLAVVVAMIAGCTLGAAQAADTPVLRVEVGTHVAPIRQLAVDPAEKWAVTVSDDKTARLWKLDTQELRAVLRVPVGAARLGSLYAAAVSPTSAEVAVAGTTGSGQGGHRIYLFDIPGASLTGVIDALAGDVKHLAWTPDGRYLIASYAGANGVRVFDRNGRLHWESALGAPSYGAAVSAQGRIAVPSFDGTVRFFMSTEGGIEPAGQVQLPIVDPVGVSFSPDGAWLAVGYHSRNGRGQVQVDVLDVDGLRVSRSFHFPDVRHGNLMHVAWSLDGSAIHAAGTGYRELRRFLVKTVDWPGGGVREAEVASDSVTRLVALSGRGVGFSTFEPSWGVLRDGRATKRRGLAAVTVKDAGSLRIHPDGGIVSWQTPGGAASVTFDLRNRRWLAIPPEGLQERGTFSLMHFRSMACEDTRSPQVNGIPIPLAAEEVSRACALLPDHSAALLGTGWNLRKLDKAGKELWRVPVPTEVRALNVTQDSRTIVMALVDGTVHWLGADDGSTLLSLLATADGRWVLTSPSGHYDAGAGSESLLGWQIDRPGGFSADFFPVSKFRDLFYRPDVIDQALRFGPAAEALAEANRTLEQAAAIAGGGGTHSASRLIQADALSAQRLPPVLTLAGFSGGVDAGSTMQIDFSAFSRDGEPLTGWQVKVNGRPAQPMAIRLPASADGKALGRLTLARPGEAGTVQLLVSNRFGDSEPINLDVAGAPRDTEPRNTADKRPNLYVLAIGVARYAHSALNLLFPAKDAKDLVQVLQQQEGGAYKKVLSRALTDTGATRQAIVDGLRWLRDSPAADDVAILFVAGHGVTLSGNLYRFLPHDADLARPHETLVTEDQLRDALVNVRGKSILFIDTCFSGRAVGQFTGHDTKLIANRLSSAENGVIVFSSSDGRQESLEKEIWNNGAFTKELIAGLRGQADFRREGVVTHKGLDYFVSHRVRQLTGGLQTPVTAVPVGVPDYALTHYAARPPGQETASRVVPDVPSNHHGAVASP